MSQRIWFLLKFFLFHLLIFVGLRALFFVIFQSSSADYDLNQLKKAVYLGFKFDIRLALALLIPVYILGYFSFFNHIRHNSNPWLKKLWLSFYGILFFAWSLIYLLDFGYYGYLQTRVNGSVMQFAANPDLSVQMVWQTYPVIPGAIGLIVLFYVYLLILKNFIFLDFKYKNISIPSQLFSNIVFFLLFAVGVYGKFSTFPLRWSEAFFSQNNFLSAMGLNPVLYLIETYRYQKADFDKEKVKNYYALIATHLGVPVGEQNKESLNFKRSVPLNAKPKLAKPNIIIVVMESMAIHKTSLSDNPLNTTPNIKRIADDGYFNSEYYVPSEGTARSMFTLLTAIPDVSTYKTASRNPLIVDQNVILDQFPGYRKFYFLGGNANWGQIRSVFSHNVEGVEIVEEGQFERKPVDVWGLSDLDLFKEVDRILNDVPDSQPFFAVVQAASFHRPYTIPKDRDDFKEETYPEDLVRKASFLNNEEMNSLRFSDYSLGVFYDRFLKSKFASNTILVVVGDHGLPDQNAPHIPFYRRKLSIEKFHVPLIIHNKTLFPTPLRDTKVATEMDIMSTIAGFTGTPYINTTFGRDLFDSKFDSKRLAFTVDYYAQPHQYGVFDGEFYILVRGEKEELFKFNDAEEVVNLNTKYPEKFEELKNFARGYYETSKYMLYNNPKSLRTN